MRSAIAAFILSSPGTGCTDYQIAAQGEAIPSADTSPPPLGGLGEGGEEAGEAKARDTAPPSPRDTARDTARDTQLEAPEECEPDEGVAATPIDEACEIEAVVGTFTPEIEWTSRAPGNAEATPLVANLSDDDGDGDIDADDDPDVVVMGNAGLLTVLSGDGARTLWTFDTGGGDPPTPAVGDVDGDGSPDVIAGARAGIYALEADGTQKWFYGFDSALSNAAYCGAVAIHDLDADGQPEVVFANLILDGASGEALGRGAYGQGSGYSGNAAVSVVADVDQDGDQEVVVGNALYDRSGATIWYNGLSDGFPAVANFDEDDYGEIVVSNGGSVRLQDQDGSLIWETRIHGSASGPPSVADFDGDGAPEIGVACMDAYVVLETDGSERWRRETQDHTSGFTGSAVFDFEGDGVAEVVYADETTVWVFNGPDGAVKLEETAHASGTCIEYPAVADVDKDGQAEIIYASNAYGADYYGVTVIGDADDSWRPGRVIWNQHGYAITNIEDDGAVPATPEANWLRYNSFRSGDLAAASGGAFADAVPLADVCTDECDSGRVTVTVRAGNGGVAELAAGLALSVWSSGGGEDALIAEEVVADPIAPGETSRGFSYELELADIPGGELTVIVDDGPDRGVYAECHEDNNVLSVVDLCEDPEG